jgi:hypothetical protein
MTQVPTRETPLKTRVDRFEKLIIAAVNIRRKILEVETGWSAKVSDELQHIPTSTADRAVVSPAWVSSRLGKEKART